MYVLPILSLSQTKSFCVWIFAGLRILIVFGLIFFGLFVLIFWREKKEQTKQFIHAWVPIFFFFFFLKLDRKS